MFHDAVHPPPDPSSANVLAHAGWVRNLARRLVADAADAEDLAQDVLAASLGRAPASGDARPWFARSLRHRAIDRHRARESGRRALAERARGLQAFEDADPVERADTARHLMEHVLALEEPARSTILQRWMDERTPSEIARRDGVPLSTVESRLARGMRELRRRLERQGRTRDEWLGALVALAREPSPAGAAGPHALGAAAAGAASPFPIAALIAPLMGWTMPKLLGITLALALCASLALLRPWADRGPAPTSSVATSASGIAASAGEPDLALALGAGERTLRSPSAATTAGEGAPNPAGAGDLLLTGSVVDLLGAALPAAEVNVEPDPIATSSDGRGKASALTAADGTFQLALAPGGWRVRARADGFAPSRWSALEVQPAVTPPALRFELARGAALAVRAWGLDGRPVAERAVRLSGPAIEGPSVRWTDARGDVALEHMAPGTWKIETWPEESELAAASAAGWLDARERFRQVAVIELADGERRALELGAPASDPVTVRGRLTRAGAGVRGLLRWQRDSAGPVQVDVRVATDDAGSFEATLDGHGPWRVLAQRPDAARFEFPPTDDQRARGIGAATVSAQPGLESSRWVLLPPGPTAQVDFDLGAAFVRGRVVDERGRPVPAHLTLALEAGAAGAPSAFELAAGNAAWSTAQGDFALEDVPAGRYVLRACPLIDGSVADADHDWPAAAWIEGLQVGPGGVEGLRVQLRSGRCARGRLVIREPQGAAHPAGAPSQGLSVAAVAVFDAGGRLLAPPQWFPTAADGACCLPPLSPGRYRLAAFDGLRASAAVEFELAPIAPPNGAPEFVLELLPARSLTVELVDERGVPAVGPAPRLLDAAGCDWGALAFDAQGPSPRASWASIGLPGQPWRVVATDWRGRRAELSVPSGHAGGALRVRLEGPGSGTLPVR